MKLLLFFIFCFFSCAAFSQNTPGYKNRQGLLNLQNENSLNKNDSAITMMERFLEFNNMESGVINLSQDHMPCVIPNIKMIRPMPNAWKGNLPGRKRPGKIPNPAQPVRPFVIPIAE